MGAGVAAYVLWGLFPLYWPLLEPAGALEILAHRIAWSFLFVLLFLVVGPTGLTWVRDLDRRRVKLLALAAVLITVNWATFIYGVNADRVVETSLGYFMNPLVTVALAVGLVGERLRRAQCTAVAIAALGVVVLGIDYGHPPWIALVLAFSFALYGFTKKRVGLDGTQSLMVETSVLVIPAVAFIVWLEASGRGTIASEGGAHAALLASAGITTAIPLVLFGAAAIRLPLTTLGLLQYLAPIMQFLTGVLVYSEPLPTGRLIGFSIVWVALIVFSIDAYRTGRASRGAQRAADVVAAGQAGAPAPELAGVPLGR